MNKDMNAILDKYESERDPIERAIDTLWSQNHSGTEGDKMADDAAAMYAALRAERDELLNLRDDVGKIIALWSDGDHANPAQGIVFIGEMQRFCVKYADIFGRSG